MEEALDTTVRSSNLEKEQDLGRQRSLEIGRSSSWKSWVGNKPNLEGVLLFKEREIATRMILSEMIGRSRKRQRSKLISADRFFRVRYSSILYGMDLYSHIDFI